MSATILVVDDMPYIREPIAASLRLAGYETLCAASGAEALSIVRKHQPALILLDLEMPGMSGLDLLRRLLRVPEEHRPRTIMLTASQDRASVLKAGELGVRHFMLKSTFSLANLLDRVKTVLAETPASAQPAAASEPGSAHGAGQDPTLGESGASKDPAVPSEVSTLRPAGASPPGAALGDLSPLMTRAELLRHVERAGELRALSPAVAEVLEMSEDPSATTEAIAGAIKRDQVLALKILKLANSSAYSLGKKTTSVDQAVVRIGMGAIRQALLNIGVIDSLGAGGADCAIDPLRFWEHSIACGLIAAEIEQATGGAAPDTTFTLGLLHDVGRLVLAEALGAAYREVLDASERLRIPLEAAESHLLGLNHAEIMPDVLRRWNVPKSLVEPIVSHHERPDAGGADAPRPGRDTAVLQLADRLAHALLLGTSGNETLYPIADLCRQLGLEEPALRRIVDTAGEQTREVKIALLASSAQAGWPDHRETYRARLAGPFRPLCVSAAGTIESFQIACETLASTGPAKPNLGIVSIGPADDLATLSERYRTAQVAAGVKGLPTITLSPDGRGLREGGSGSRTALTTPVSLSTLVEAVNTVLSPSMKKAA